jgi:hypothetical protein
MKFFESRMRLVAPLVVMCCLIGMSSHVAQATTTIVATPTTCTPAVGQLCSPPFATAVNLTQTGPITINFTASPHHCSSIEVHVYLDNVLITTSAFLGPGQSTGPILLAASASAGSHTIGLQAEGEVGGCNSGILASWTGTLAITAQTTTYTSDPSIADFTNPITSYATFSNYSSNTGCTVSPFTPTSAELLTTSCRVFGGTLAGTGLAAGNNWILASFSEPVSTIVVFPNMDHFGSAYDGYQYTIAGSNDGINWTVLFDATSVTGAGEPFTLGTSTGIPPVTVNNVLTPQTPLGGGLPAGCSSPNPPPCEVGYIATFNFPTAYQFYAFGASTVAVAQGNADQEFSAVGTTAATAARVGIFPPTSGALLTINGTVGATVVNRNIHDSQIHTGTVRQVPVGDSVSNCNANDQTFPTDAYVLQGSSWTGCDAGDTFELQASGNATVSGPGYSFAITTSYTSGSNTNNSVSVGASALTGFLTIMNNSGVGNDFSGTITLSGTAVGLTAANATFCPPAGGASDTITTLAANASAVLALSTDSSNCGGFNAPQTKTLTAGMTSIFQIGNDDYQITPFDSASGDRLTVLPIPVPAGPVGLGNTYPTVEPAPCTPTLIFNCTPEPLLFPTTSFSASNFPGQACIAYDDLSASGNPVCLEFQLSCFNTISNAKCADALTFLYTSQLDFTKDTHSLGTIGGTAFLGQHDGSPTNAYLGQCPTNGFNLNNFFSYTATAPDPITGSGRGNSCYVGSFDPTAAPIPVGQTLTQKTFVGFQNPVSDTAMNMIKAGQAVPLIWQTFSDPAGTIPVTNLTLCQDLSGASCPSSTPWVFIGTIPISCLTDDVGIDTVPTVASGSSGLQNFGNGTYQFNMKTSKTAAGCFTTVLGFSTGLWSIGVADFKFTH